MPTQSQTAKTEKELREYRKRFLTKKQNLEVDESATRIMVNALLTDVLGYAELDDIKTEFNIRGIYADYVIQLARKKHMVIEVKSIQLNLTGNHLRQAVGYAADEGIEWALLTNGRQLKLYRVIVEKTVSKHLVFNYDLADLSTLKKAAADISYLSKKCVQKGELDDYWKRFDALTPANVVKAIYTEDVIRAIRLRVKKNCGMNFDQAEITDAIQDLLIREHPDAVRPKNLKK